MNKLYFRSILSSCFVKNANVVRMLQWIVFPLRVLYFHGPNLWGYGFWQGVAPADACATLTGTGADMWTMTLETAAACEDLLERHFLSFCVSVGAILVAWTIWAGCSLAWHYCVYRLIPRGHAIDSRLQNVVAVVDERSFAAWTRAPQRLLSTDPDESLSSSSAPSRTRDGSSKQR